MKTKIVRSIQFLNSFHSTFICNCLFVACVACVCVCVKQKHTLIHKCTQLQHIMYVVSRHSKCHKLFHTQAYAQYRQTRKYRVDTCRRIDSFTHLNQHFQLNRRRERRMIEQKRENTTEINETERYVFLFSCLCFVFYFFFFFCSLKICLLFSHDRFHSIQLSGVHSKRNVRYG